MEFQKTSKKSMKAAEMPAAAVAVTKAPRAASKAVKSTLVKITPAKASAPKTTAHRHSKVTAQPTASVNYDEVARLAYKYWEERLHADGFAEEDWHRAEQAVRAR